MGDKSAYYSSHGKLPFIGKGGQQQLERQKVLVIGAGGLGCPCLLALAGAGIGTIGIADFDSIAISNIHRQPLYQPADAGKLKTDVAGKKLSQYNPFINILLHPVYVADNNILHLVSSYDVIADCTDNFATRYLVNDACVYLNKPLVYGAIHQSEGHLTVFNYHNSPTLRCLFPKDDTESFASCAEIGAYNISTAIIGNMMANEVIKILMQHPEVSAGTLKNINVLDGSMLSLQYHSSPDGRKKSIERFSFPATALTITPASVSKKIKEAQHIFLLDVREPQEHQMFNIGGANIPLPALQQATSFPFSPAQEIIVYCQKGNRSMQAASLLSKKGFTNVVSMEGGIELWQHLLNSET
jgi:adenylyltransferase/sulfurtransferase